jgi:glycosyltransferase involved in cell wall biosynthesis
MTAPAPAVAPPAKPQVLVLLGGYWPGSDSSGPNQSFRSLALALRDEFSFLQVSRDRPFGGRTPLIESGRWFDRGYVKARYCQPSAVGARGLRDILVNTPHDLLVLNGFFDREFTVKALLLRHLGLAPRKPTIVSPRGEFSQGALSLKGGQKAAFLKIARALGLHRDICIHATSDQELADIRAVYPIARSYAVAGNIRALLTPAPPTPRQGPLRLAFIGRISPVKNLLFSIEVLAGVAEPVDFSIYGPKQDTAYWAACEAAIARLPAHIRVRHAGEIDNESVPDALGRADLFLMPSLSENFGHAIFEALSCGVPVLIGDQTPWRNLEAKDAGWDLPLDRADLFAARISAMARYEDARQTHMRSSARRAAETMVAASGAVERNREMFRALLSEAHDAHGSRTDRAIAASSMATGLS